MHSRLKDAISSYVVLAYPSMGPRHEPRRHTDASDTAVSAVLTQMQDGVERPISFASRQLKAAEKKLTVVEKEISVICRTKK